MGQNELMRVIQWLDEKRWCSETNYNLIRNSIFDNLADDKKILVHWISYITDRQMPFEKIWTDGGIVFAGMIDEYSNGCEYDDLKKFINIDNNKIKFQYNENTFASRFVSTDLKSILLTLKILSEDFNKNLLEYINKTFNDYKRLVEENKNIGANNVNLIAFILYLMSYKFIENNKPNEGEKQIAKYFDEVDSYYDNFNRTIKNLDYFSKEYIEFVKYRFENKKRVWCCVRDYLKSKEFNKYFMGALLKIDNNLKLVDVINDESECYNLELPGDVWNMNALFIKKLVEPNLGLYTKNYSKELRKILESPYYPELFDLTFDFVPRMCANSANAINKSMCEVCIFGKSGMKMYCHGDSTKACPIIMISCGYNVACNKENCPVYEGTSAGLCHEIS